MKKAFGVLAVILSVAMLSACDDAAARSETQENNGTEVSAEAQTSLETQDASVLSSLSGNTSVSDQTVEASSSVSEITEKPEEDNRRITLSGKREDSILTSDYSYVMGERCVLFLDKEVLLPGDFAANVDLIVNTLEEVTGLEFPPAKYSPMVSKQTDYLGFDPWKDVDYCQRVPVYVYTDLNDEHYISCANSNGVIFFFYELINPEVWNSVPTYRDNAWRRHDFIPYEYIAHEMTHFLTLRYASMNNIMTEGAADFYAGKVLDALENVSRDFSESKANYYLLYAVKNDVTPKNAEEIFRNDNADVDFAERGDEYTLGRMLCAFLEENYGQGFLQDYMNALDKKGYGYPKHTFRIPEAEDPENYTAAFKETFGDDVFEQFGKYYQTHKKE